MIFLFFIFQLVGEHFIRWLHDQKQYTRKRNSEKARLFLKKKKKRESEVPLSTILYIEFNDRIKKRTIKRKIEETKNKIYQREDMY